jgi:hypothetical protein
VNEPLELSKTEEPLQELTAQLLSVETPVLEEAAVPQEVPASDDGPAPQWTGPAWQRLAYAVEFLVALVAILNVWSEIGGQGHLDLMPWHIKLVCILGLAWCCVRFTASIVEQSKVWTGRTVAWFAGILLFGVAMGAITYYYHLHEEPQDDDEDTTAASVRITKPGVSLPGVFLYDARKGKELDANHGNQR